MMMFCLIAIWLIVKSGLNKQMKIKHRISTWKNFGEAFPQQWDSMKYKKKKTTDAHLHQTQNRYLHNTTIYKLL